MKKKLNEIRVSSFKTSINDLMLKKLNGGGTNSECENSFAAGCTVANTFCKTLDPGLCSVATCIELNNTACKPKE